MKLKLNRSKKIFIVGAIITALALCAYSFSIAWEESEQSALASPGLRNVNVKLAANINYQVGGKYSVTWDSDCRGGEAIVWLSTASSSKASISILVPLVNFSAANFGNQGQDTRIYFTDPWQFDQSHTANNGKSSWTVPAQLNLSKSLFGGTEGVYYIYSLADGRLALHKIVKEQVQMPVMTDNYYLRVDIKGKNGCTAAGYSSAIKIIR